MERLEERALLSTGPVGWWPGNGSTADIAGTNPGTLINGATYGTGEVGQAFSLNGSGQYVQVPNSSLWHFGTSDFTVALWANFASVPNSTITDPGDIFVGNDEGPGNVNKWFFALGGGDLNFHINSPTIGPIFLAEAPFAPNLNQWYFLAVTRSAGTYTISVNGTKVSSQADSHAIPSPNAPLTIGQAEGIGFVDGLLDEVQIYHRALSAAQLTALYNAGAQGPAITISGGSATRGDSGTTPVPFTVSLSAITSLPVTVNYATADGTAKAGVDYQAASGTLTLNPGQASQTLKVQAIGSMMTEPDKTFSVNLSAPTDAFLKTPKATGKILNDDNQLSIDNVSQTEGGSSGSTPFVFTVTLSPAAPFDVTVHFKTVDGTAKAGVDYTAESGTLTIPAGQTTGKISVPYIGNPSVDAGETFSVKLSMSSNALIAVGTGTGTIVSGSGLALGVPFPFPGPVLLPDVTSTLLDLPGGHYRKLAAASL
jgi:hypothetical protein